MEKRVSKPRTPPMTVRRSTLLQRENDPPHLNSKGETSNHPLHPQPLNNVEAGATPLNITEDEKKKEKMGRSRGTRTDA
ncbi:hypothetical protein ES332_D09G183200v1 [Gossypium tomentosum]|uniref:Uncharacterized protein n=1 Tax=Gossypium tomentosum TaxID=34277 RepID=A0A5D2JIN1_GOSTO|nr:hypothetical protein ES332_D09G183200v1 [Gossypium tomentosum]